MLSELGPVYIEPKKGKSFKVIRINSIDTVSGKVEYLAEGVFHDIRISNINRIAPAESYNTALFFENGNKPKIKFVIEYDSFRNFETFKSHEPVKQKKEESNKPIIKKEKKDSVTNTKVLFDQLKPPLAQDTIIFSDKKLVVKIISIDDETVTYKRADLLEGPLYSIKIRIPGRTTNAIITTKNKITIVDYSK